MRSDRTDNHVKYTSAHADASCLVQSECIQGHLDEACDFWEENKLISNNLTVITPKQLATFR